MTHDKFLPSETHAQTRLSLSMCVLHAVFNVKYLGQVHKGLCSRIHDPPKYPDKILFCGWRRDIDDMIMVIL